MGHKTRSDEEGRLPFTLFWHEDTPDGKGKWHGQDFETVHDAASYAAYNLGDCCMRMIIWDWPNMKPHSASAAWTF